MKEQCILLRKADVIVENPMVLVSDTVSHLLKQCNYVKNKPLIKNEFIVDDV